MNRLQDVSSVKNFIVKLSKVFIYSYHFPSVEFCSFAKNKRWNKRYTKIQNASSAPLFFPSKASCRPSPHRLLSSCGAAGNKPYADVLQYSWISKMMKRTDANKLPWDNNTRNITKSKPNFLYVCITDHSYSFSLTSSYYHCCTFVLHLRSCLWS